MEREGDVKHLSLFVAVMVVMLSAVLWAVSWGHDCPPCPEKKAPAYVARQGNGFTNTKPRAHAAIHRESLPVRRAEPCETWIQRNDRWLLPVAFVGAVLIGHALRDCDGDRVVVVGGSNGGCRGWDPCPGWGGHRGCGK